MKAKCCLLILVLAFVLGATQAFAQSKPSEVRAPVDLKALLTDAGHKPVRVREGLWSISVTDDRTQHIKALLAFVEINPYTHNLRISARIGTHDHIEENNDLKDKVTELAKRLAPTELSLTTTALFVVIELPPGPLDKAIVNGAIHKIFADADRAYPEVAQFIKLDAPESSGSGAGAGVGTGGGVGPAESQSVPTRSTSRPVEVDSKPEILSRPQPNYTSEARKNRIQGAVTLRLTVDETGAAKDIRVVRGLPDGLSEKAIENAWRTKFKPAMKDGKPVSYSILFEVEFRLY